MKKYLNRKNLFPALLSLFIFLCVMLYFWIGLLLFLSGCTYNEAADMSTAKAESLQESIADEVLRLHIIADSNSDIDQEIKLEIKDAVVTYLEPYLTGITTKAEAVEVISAQLDNLAAIADQILEAGGFSYTAAVSLERSYFPIKTYGDLTLPAGEYDALKICLGSASGKNWWCLVFPQLCFVDVTYGTLPEESREGLKAILSEEEYNLVFAPSDKDTSSINIRWKLIELLKKWF